MEIIIDDSKRVQRAPRVSREPIELKPEVVNYGKITVTINRSPRKRHGLYDYEAVFTVKDNSNKYTGKTEIGRINKSVENKAEFMKVVSIAIDNAKKRLEKYSVGKYTFSYGRTKDSYYAEVFNVTREGVPFDYKKFSGSGYRRTLKGTFDVLTGNPQEFFGEHFKEIEEKYLTFIKTPEQRIIEHKGFKVVLTKEGVDSYDKKVVWNKKVFVNNKELSSAEGNEVTYTYNDTDEEFKKSIDEYIKTMDSLPLLPDFEKSFKVIVNDITRQQKLVKKSDGTFYVTRSKKGIFSSEKTVDNYYVCELLEIRIRRDKNEKHDFFVVNSGRGRYSDNEPTEYKIVTDLRDNSSRVKKGYTTNKMLKSNLNKVVNPYLKVLDNSPEEKTRRETIKKEKEILESKRLEAEKIKLEIMKKQEELRKLNEVN